MKLITEEEAMAISTKPVGRVTFIRSMMVNMKPGQYLRVENHDWKWKKKTPSTMCRRLEKRSSLKFECKRMLGNTGWLIKRIK